MAHLHYVLKPSNVGADLGRWSLQGCVDWHEWEGEFVVRSDSTAATHRLSCLAGETIKALSEGPAHIDELATRVRHALDRLNAATATLVATFTVSGSNTRKLLAVLADLEELGLVRRAMT